MRDINGVLYVALIELCFVSGVDYKQLRADKRRTYIIASLNTLFIAMYTSLMSSKMRVAKYLLVVWDHMSKLSECLVLDIAFYCNWIVFLIFHFFLCSLFIYYNRFLKWKIILNFSFAYHELELLLMRIKKPNKVRFRK